VKFSWTTLVRALRKDVLWDKLCRARKKRWVLRPTDCGPIRKDGGFFRGLVYLPRKECFLSLDRVGQGV
jgi:hypothetical protein